MTSKVTILRVLSDDWNNWLKVEIEKEVLEQVQLDLGGLAPNKKKSPPPPMLTLSSSGKKKFRASPQSIGLYSNFFFPGRERVSSEGGGEIPVGLSKIFGRESCPIAGLFQCEFARSKVLFPTPSPSCLTGPTLSNTSHRHNWARASSK
jgi:hypothetical protein